MKRAELIAALNAIEDPNDSDVNIRVTGPEGDVIAVPGKVTQSEGGLIVINAAPAE